MLGGTRAVRGFDAVGDTLAFVASMPTALGELFVRDADGTERRLTHLGAGVPAAIDPERFVLDGVDVWIVRPEGEYLPVLLSIHGGPLTQYATEYATAWFDEFQMWAAAGYAVVYCSPHGSTGGTEAFSREIRAPEAPGHAGSDCAGRAAQDVLDAAGLFRHEIGVSHVDSPEVDRAQSLVHAARDIHAPVLILHSENDLRCPPGQADQLFVALLGREVEYWRFSEEGHELSRSGSPRHRIQRAELILDFFGRHLGGRRPEVSWPG